MQTLKDSELRYRSLFEAAQDGVLILDAQTGMIEDVNPFLIKMLGFSREEFVKKKLWEVGAFRDMEASRNAFEVLQANKYIRYEDLPLRTKDGRLIQVEFVSNVYLVGDEKVIQCNIRDITEHRRIIVALEENEKKYHDLVNQSPDGVFIIAPSGNILTVNKAMCRELEYREEELLFMTIWDIIPQRCLDQYKIRLTNMLKGESLDEAAEYVVEGKDGKIHYVEILSAPHYSGRDIIGFQGIARDITTRKQTEEALLQSESSLLRLIEYLPTVVYTNAIGDASSTLYISPQIKTLMGYTPQEWLADPKSWPNSLHPKDYERVMTEVATANQSQEPFELEYRMIARDGHTVWVHDQVTPVKDLQGRLQLWQGVMRDITERKESESALRESDERFRQVWETTSDAMALSDPEGLVLANNPAYLDLYGYDSQQVTGNSFALSFPEAYRELAVEQYKIIFNNESIPATFESVIQRADGTERIVETRVTFLYEAGQRTAMLSTICDITARKLAEEEIRQRLSELEVLYQSGLALSQLVNPKAIAQMMIDLLDKKMDWHHTTVRLYDPQSEIFELLAFNQPNLKSEAERQETEQMLVARMTSSKGDFSDWVIQHGVVVCSDDLKNDPRYVETFPGLRSGLYVPMKIKERVIGVISIESEAVQAFSESDEHLASTLATQAAIAIENAQLFVNLKRSNVDLALAYDATIEGWSRALDLRDRETEGHSQRVTDITLSLARSMGLSKPELVHIRRGALLHDIGKMGIPDDILLKPGKLTEQEWVMMRQHPRLAYNMLSPIAYLKLALDIPYCHHEKWDGTGYPRGLKGEQIPLTARIFAVVDVWDALRSDRPYRLAWAEEKVREYILASSGKHFDPYVVNMFMQIPQKGVYII